MGTVYRNKKRTLFQWASSLLERLFCRHQDLSDAVPVLRRALQLEPLMVCSVFGFDKSLHTIGGENTLHLTTGFNRRRPLLVPGYVLAGQWTKAALNHAKHVRETLIWSATTYEELPSS